MTKSVQERSTKAAAKRLLVAEMELRHKVRPGIELAMGRIRTRSRVRTISEVLQIAVMKMGLMNDGELKAFLSYPRHKILISENVAHEFLNQSLAEPKRVLGDEQEVPSILYENR